MNVQDMSRAADDSAARTLIGATVGALAKRNSAVPEAFVAELFGLAATEDLQRYRPEELAAIAERSWAFFAERKPGAPNISFEPVPTARAVAVLEIVNDDMPFLFDSVLGELNQRGLDIRLMVHPVFTVERNAAGELIAFKGTQKAEGQRESFIHIHVDGAANAARRAEIVGALGQVLTDVRLAVQDWQPMLTRAREIIAALRANPPPLHAARRPRLRFHRRRGCARTAAGDGPWAVAIAGRAAAAERYAAGDIFAGDPGIP
jgi:glutamate dehydrogenase